jgi:hypothetical protein
VTPRCHGAAQAPSTTNLIKPGRKAGLFRCEDRIVAIIARATARARRIAATELWLFLPGFAFC